MYRFIAAAMRLPACKECSVRTTSILLHRPLISWHASTTSWGELTSTERVARTRCGTKTHHPVTGNIDGDGKKQPKAKLSSIEHTKAKG